MHAQSAKKFLLISWGVFQTQSNIKIAQLTFTCSTPTIETLERGLRSGVFIVNFEHISPFSSVTIANFEQINVSWENFLRNQRYSVVKHFRKRLHLSTFAYQTKLYFRYSLNYLQQLVLQNTRFRPCPFHCSLLPTYVTARFSPALKWFKDNWKWSFLWNLWPFFTK